MLEEAEITNLYGIENAVLGQTTDGRNPTFSFSGCSEVTGTASRKQPKISLNLLPYLFLSKTTGSELNDIDLLVVVESISEQITTAFQTRFEFKGWVRKTSYIESVKSNEHISSFDTNSLSAQAERLREISGLTIERLAEIFDVSRTTYYKWISGSPLHDVHREHLLEVLPLLEEVAQHLASLNATSTWLLTPVSPGGKKPIDYLASREYAIFRGFLLRVRTNREAFRPLTPSNRIYKERSPEEVQDTLERLRPQAWRDDNDMDKDKRDLNGGEE
jgi:transcriptional regulator with XRE-family HTH domain